MVSGRAFSQAWGSYRSHQEEERLSHRPPLLVATMSLRPAIPQRVARQQSPPPLHRLDAILKSGGEVCQSRMKLKKNPLDTASRFQRWLPALESLKRNPSLTIIQRGPTVPAPLL